MGLFCLLLWHNVSFCLTDVVQTCHRYLIVILPLIRYYYHQIELSVTALKAMLPCISDLVHLWQVRWRSDQHSTLRAGKAITLGVPGLTSGGGTIGVRVLENIGEIHW